MLIAKYTLQFLHLYLQSMSVVAKIIVSCYDNILVLKYVNVCLGRSKDMIDWGRDTHSNVSNQLSLCCSTSESTFCNGSIKTWILKTQMDVHLSNVCSVLYYPFCEFQNSPFRALKFKLELNLANVNIILQSVWNPLGNQLLKFLVTSGYCKISFLLS